MNKPFKIPESVLVVIHTEELDVLLIERADRPGFWQSVTGSKDADDEPLWRTAIREVFEETGIRVVDETSGEELRSNNVSVRNLVDWQLSNVYEIYPVWRHRYAPGITKNTEHVFGLLVPALFQLASEAHLLRGTDIRPEDLLELVDPLLQPLRQETFLFSPPWLRALTTRMSDPRSTAARIQRKLNAPVRTLLIQRVAAGTTGVLCSLQARVPLRQGAETWLPGLTASQGA